MSKEQLKILIVEDDEDYAFLIKDYLKEKLSSSKDLIIHQSSNFKDSLKIISNNGTFDLYIIDYLLNHINGIELVKEIRSRGIDSPIIFLTGYGNEEIAVSALRAGATDYLSKAKLTAELLNHSVHHAFEVVCYYRQRIEYEDKLFQKTQELERLNKELEERVALEIKKNRENEHMFLLQNRLAAMGEMLGFITHQWKQPLTAIGLIAQGLEEDCGTGAFTKEYVIGEIKLILDIIKHLTITIDDFKSFLQTNQMICLCHLKDIVSKVINIVGSSFKDARITMNIEMLHDSDIACQPNQLCHVLLNILNNARDVLIEREVPNPTVTIIVDRKDDKAIISIKDNAGGIDEKILPHIFDPYVTTKKEGSGIGLYMSRLIVEQKLNGRIYAQSTSQGAEFIIEL